MRKFVIALVLAGLVGAGSYAWAAARATHTTASCATSSTLALAANGARDHALFVNDSDTAIYVKVGAAAVVNEGIRVNANGGSWEMSELFGNLDGRAVFCIHGGAGTKTLTVMEVVE